MSVTESLAKFSAAERAAQEAEALASTVKRELAEQEGRLGAANPTSASSYDALVSTVAGVRQRAQALENRAVAARGAASTAAAELSTAKREEARQQAIAFDRELAADATELAAYFQTMDEQAVALVEAHGAKLKAARVLAQQAGTDVANRTVWSGCVDTISQGRGVFWGSIGDALDNITSRAHVDMVEASRLAAAQAQARRNYQGK